MNKVKKIIKLQKRLDRNKNLSEKQKVKIMNKITRLQKNFLYTGKDTVDEKKLHMYITNFGRQILVEDYKIVFATKPKFVNNSPMIPYLLAFAVMIILFFIAVFLNFFGIVSDDLLLSISLVLSSAGVIMNAWTIYDCREAMKQFKFLLWINIGAMFMNGFNVYNNILQMIG